MARLEDIRIDLIDPNPYQPRADFNEKQLKSLANSIKEDGLLQPIVVIEDGNNGRYTLVGGERRVRATKLLDEVTISAKIIDFTQDREKLLRRGGIIENSQRADLNFLEECQAVAELKNDLSYSYQEIAELFGRTGQWASTRYWLMTEGFEGIKSLIKSGEITQGYTEVAQRWLNNWKGIEDDLIKAYMNKKWHKFHETRAMADFLKKNKAPVSLARCVLLYKEVFSMNNLELLFELSQGEIERICQYFLSANDGMPATEQMLKEIIKSVKNKREQAKKASQLREVLAEQEKEAEKATRHAQEEYQRKVRILKHKIKQVYDDEGDVLLTEEQEKEVLALERKLEAEKKRIEQEREERKQKALQAWEEQMMAVNEKIVNVRREVYKRFDEKEAENPYREPLAELMRGLFEWKVVTKDFVNIDHPLIIEQLSQEDFENLQTKVDLVMSRIKDIYVEVAGYKELIERRKSNPKPHLRVMR